MLSGALATAASLLALAYIATAGSGSSAPIYRVPRVAAVAHAIPATDDSFDGTAGSRTSERELGRLVLVDVSPSVPSLDDELDRQRALALQQGQRVLLWVVVADCKPCSAVDAALSSRELQAALASSRLVRVNAVDFLAELSRMGIPMDAFPAFVRLGPDGSPVDYVDGGEWDDDVPVNIAPVLKSFIEGSYDRRRSPWRGGLHEDETPI